MKKPQSCLNCLNFKVNLSKESARCAIGKFACEIWISPDKMDALPDRMRSLLIPLYGFTDLDGYRWVFDTDLEYWALWCSSYDHNAGEGGE